MLGRPGTRIFGTYPPVTAPETLCAPGNPNLSLGAQALQSPKKTTIELPDLPIV
jgi:hypothetical protein